MGTVAEGTGGEPGACGRVCIGVWREGEGGGAECLRFGLSALGFGV